MFTYSFAELYSLAEEGRRGKFKAAKLIRNLNTKDIERGDLITLLNKLLDEKDEQLEELVTDNITYLSQYLSKEALESLIEDLIEINNSSHKRLAGMITLRNLEKIDKDMALEIATRLIFNKKEGNRYLGLALIKELKPFIKVKEELQEIIERLLKNGEENTNFIVLRLLEIFGHKLGPKEVYNYLLYMIESEHGSSSLGLILEEIDLFKSILGKGLFNALQEYIERYGKK